MKLEQSFEVAAPLERVWEALIDVRRVAPCLPGAEIEPDSEDGTYRGSFTVKLGPTTASYRGQLSLEEVDEAAHRVVMRARGQDKRGQGTAKASIVSVLSPQGEGTKVHVETDFTLTGRLARFGRGGMIQDVSNRLLRDFSSCLQSSIESEQSSAAAGAGGDAAGGEAVTAPAPMPGDVAPTVPLPGPQVPAPARPVSGLSLFFGVLLDRLRRLFGGAR